jgi:hypothetical protein
MRGTEADFPGRNEVKHTPGDWKVAPKVYHRKEDGAHAFVEIVSDKSIFWLARVQTFSDDPGEYAANANVLAAAPDLLSAVKTRIALGSGLNPFGHDCVLGCMACMERLKAMELAAVAKAEAR